jgi:hypothetical protein
MKSLAKLAFPLIVLIAASSPLLAAQPTITSATANATNTVLTVVGTNLSPQGGKSLLVSLDDMTLTVTSSSSTGLTANLPAGLAPGSYHLYVNTAGNPNDNGHLAALDVTLPATGPKGATGATGATGPMGATGAAGSNGATGSPGSPGANGMNGAPGANGATGPAGAQGPTGPMGAKGDPGDPGAPGAPGATGPTGPAGGGGSSIIPVISMVWSSSTTPIPHPADGQIGCNNADPTSAAVTQIWSSFAGTDHIDYSSLFNAFSFDSGGYLVIRNVSPGNGSPQNILVFPLSRFGYNANIGNGNQTMSCTAATIYLGASFSDGDQVIVSFLPPAPDLP